MGSNRSRRGARQAGLSLVEAVVVLAVVATLASMALPGVAGMGDRQRLRGAADNLRGDLQFARSEAIKRRAHVFVGFSTGPDWCYAVSTGTPCGCGVACAAPENLIRQTLSSEAAAGVELLSASFAGTLCGGQECVRFEAFHGNALGSNGTATFRGADGSTYKVIVSGLGRVRTCRDAGDPGGWVPEC